MVSFVICVMSISLCVLLICCANPTSKCSGKYKQCGDKKCCCLQMKANCANFGKNLNYIPKFHNSGINKLWFTNNSLPDISAVTFENLENSSFIEIHLANNNIETFAEDAFETLKKMALLDLTGNNKIQHKSLWNSLKSLRIAGQISLILNDIAIRTIDDDPFRELQNCNISVSKIHMVNNRIEHLNFSAFSGLDKLEHLDISFNKISQVSNPVLLPLLKRLYLSGNEISKYPRFLCSNDKRVLYFPLLEILDLGNNFISELKAENWKCLHALQKLYLKGNVIKTIPKNVFSRLTNLVVLDVSQMKSSLKHIHPLGFNSSSLTKLLLTGNNLIFYKMYKDDKTINIFKSCPNLEILVISKNQLCNLNDSQILDMFSNLKNLKTLIAVDIKLMAIPPSFISIFPKLTRIDLDGNSIKSLKMAFEGVYSLQKFSVQANNIQVVENGVFPETLMHSLKELNLGENPLDCSCKMLWFRDWIDKNTKRRENVADASNTIIGGNITLLKWPNSYICRSPNEKQGSKFSDYHPSEETCKTHDPLTIAYVVIGSFVSVFTIVSLIIYKKQWYIKYIFYKMKIKAYNTDSERQPLLNPTDLHFDGYVIYSDEDRNFVHNDLIQILEDKFGYKLHIWHRNADSGSKLEVMVQAIYNSNNVIAIISKQFMKDNWCHFAMDVAMDRQVDIKQENLVLVILEDVDLKSLNKYWCVILTKTPTANWCENESDIKRSVFEQKCIQQLGSPLQIQ